MSASPRSSAASAASSAAAAAAREYPQESVLAWVAPALPPVVRPPRYHSTHDPLAPGYAPASSFLAASVRRSVGGIGRQAAAGDPAAYLRAHDAFLRRGVI